MWNLLLNMTCIKHCSKTEEKKQKKNIDKAILKVNTDTVITTYSIKGD